MLKRVFMLSCSFAASHPLQVKPKHAGDLADNIVQVLLDGLLSLELVVAHDEPFLRG